MRVLAVVITLAALPACSRSQANGASAEVVPAPLPGFTCFLIKDGAGAAVGGNCVRE